MQARDYITTDELNELMKSETGATLNERGPADFFHPLHVGAEKARGGVDYPIFREAALQRRIIIDDDGNRHTAWVLDTPLVVQFEPEEDW